jgi:hypothetical protein
MSVKDYVVELLPEKIYIVVMSIYLFKLNRLNQVLLGIDFDNHYELLKYKGGTPIRYFVFALVLFAVGIFIIKERYKSIRYNTYSVEVRQVIFSFILMIVIVCLLWYLIVLINIPIFKAIVAFFGSLGGWLLVRIKS